MTLSRFQRRAYGLHGSAVLIILTLVFATLSFASPAAYGETNLVLNGNLAEGSGRFPSHWHPWVAFYSKNSGFRWNKLTGRAGELELDNSAPSAWRQALYLRPGWYRVSAELRVEGVRGAAGAHLALLQSSGSEFLLQSNGFASLSPDPRGNTAWTHVEFFVREYRWGNTVAIACELGPPERPTKGRAWFRNIEVVPVARPDSSGVPIWDLEMLKHEERGAKTGEGSGDKLIGVIAAVLLTALLGWATLTVWQSGVGIGRPAIIAAVVAAVAVAALELAALPHFEGHPDVFMKSERAFLIALHGPAQAYNPFWPVDSYPPGSLYPLWFAGSMGRLVMPSATSFRILVESPPIVANFLLALTIFFVAVESTSARRGFLLMLFFALNPGLVYDTVIWGQSDSTYALPMLLAAVLILRRRRVGLGWATAALGALVKPQAIALLPVLGAWTILKEKPARWVTGATALTATVAITLMPFQIGHPLGFFLQVYDSFTRRYPQASLMAFNLHALLGGWRVDDRTRVFLGISYFTLGILLVLATDGFVAWLIWRAREPCHAMFAAFVALLGFFLFAPRMHSRYLYGALVFLVPLALDAPQVTAMLVVLSATFLVNLAYTETDVAFVPRLDWIGISCTLANLFAFAAAFAWATRSVSPAKQRNVNGS